MTEITDIKKEFTKQLSDLYNKCDIDVFFYMLLEEYTGFSKVELYANKETSIDDLIISSINSAIERLRKYEPIQYIIGKSWFYNMELKVSPDVLIPRPETEELVDLIINDLKHSDIRYLTSNIRILDIGTGSGCIAIALKKNFPEAEVYAIDISQEALAISLQNAVINNVQIHFIKYDILNLKLPASSPQLPDSFDLIVSNPPYVRESEKRLMKANVLDYEPHEALFVDDDDPLLFYKAIINFLLNKNNASNTKIYLEINENLSQEVIKLLEVNHFKDIILKNDLFDKPRFISCNWIKSV